MRYVFTEHARAEMHRRGLGEAHVRAILDSPEQRFLIRPGREVCQSKVRFASKTYLLRVFVDVDRDPAEVVTAYRTSRITRYWR
ncbi:MAG: DUF4258 domain-containing protein [Gemmatimonadota bacterium]